ncbi:putative efflux protein, MATE family [Oscillibacter sp. PC13]|uniref:MATE family efflux transporter n=1 Tax=Oscillibacter sp. PC13 TaxID=1855299 RepID=UPI0008F049F6|nr:MATE family efflux transporter [Oscillibacter sp. PC13]SFP76610.1 putative efflux protein, MATE family [Oscillibacter sp. PC13]
MEHNPLARQFTAASLLRFALPNIAMMVFLSLYTIVDGICISRFVGTLALSAINMSYPLNCLELAAGIMLGTGGSAIIARELGEGKPELASRDFTCVVAAAAVVGLVFMTVGNLFLDPILNLLGTSEAQFGLCRDYTRILLYFSPAMFLQTVYQMLFVTAGKPGFGLGITVAGGLSNVVLDLLLMGPLDMGVSGAAIATGIGYCIPAVIGTAYFGAVRKGTLYFTRFRPRGRMLLQTCGNGSSEMVSNIANAATTFLFNILFLCFWGEDGVAAITIAMYFQFVFSAVDLGFSMGVAPVISYQYGAQDLPQLRHTFRVSMRFVMLCSAGMWLLSWLTIGFCMSVFTDVGSSVYLITVRGFPIYAVSFLLMGVSIFASSLFTALSNGVVSAVISFARTCLFLVGMLLLLPGLLGETGIWLAVPAAELLGLAVSVGFLVWGRKKYRY